MNDGTYWDSDGVLRLCPTGNENVEKIVAAMVYIDEHLEEHDQSTWGKKTDCGTVACYAGHALLLDGWKPFWKDGYFLTTEYFPPGDSIVPRDTASAAQEVLGLTYAQVSPLFTWQNSLWMLRRRVAEVTGGAYIPPTEEEPTEEEEI